MSQSTGNPFLPLPCARKTKWGFLICIPLRFPLQGGLFFPLSNRVGGGTKTGEGEPTHFSTGKLIGEKKNAEKEMKKKSSAKKVFSKSLQTPIACSIPSISRLCIHSSYYRLCSICRKILYVSLFYSWEEGGKKESAKSMSNMGSSF